MTMTIVQQSISEFTWKIVPKLSVVGYNLHTDRQDNSKRLVYEK